MFSEMRAFHVTPLSSGVFLYQCGDRYGNLVREESCEGPQADHDHLDTRIRQTNLGSPHFPFCRAWVPLLRSEFLDRVAGMVEQCPRTTCRDQARTLSHFFLGSRRRFGGPCCLSGCFMQS